MIVEKNGGLDDPTIPSLKFKNGSIACLQNLLPNSENEDQISDVYCNETSIASV